MIQTQNIPSALMAIHRSLVIARSMALAGADANQLARVLDWIEVLPTLLSAERQGDSTTEFREILSGLGNEFSAFAGILRDFDLFGQNRAKESA